MHHGLVHSDPCVLRTRLKLIILPIVDRNHTDLHRI